MAQSPQHLNAADDAERLGTALPPPRRNKWLLALSGAALLIWLLFLTYLATVMRTARG